MYCTICFDIEDLHFEQSDDATLWFARFMSEQALPATFFITGDKLKALQRRGRSDVIEAMGKHEVAFHSSRHSHHPTIFEFASSRSHRQAVEGLAEREYASLDQAEKVFERPIRMFGQTGGSYTPAMAEVLSARKMGFAYVPDLMGPQTYSFWIKDCLVFPRVAQLPLLDDCLDDEVEIERRLGELDAALNAARRSGAQVVYFFAAHPVRTICDGFPDAMHYGHGINSVPPRIGPNLYDASEIEHARGRFAHILQRLHGVSDLRFVTFTELFDRVQMPGEQVSVEQVQAWCDKTMRNCGFPGFPVATDDLTAAEGLCALAQLLLKNKPLPVRRISPLGPLAMPRETAATYTVQRQDMMAALGGMLRDIEQTGRLPSEVVVGTTPMGIGPFTRALVMLYCDSSAGQAVIHGQCSYLAEAIHGVGEACKMIYGWPVHDMRSDMTVMLQQTLLASWCMRPARFHE